MLKMVKETLTKLCREHNISCKEIPLEKMEFYGSKRYSEEFMLNAMVNLYNISQGNIITFGGFSACSKLLGFRQMRRVSNDLDCITNIEGFKILYQSFGQELFQTSNYKDLFLEYLGLPVSFDIEETHDWKIPDDFFEESILFSFPIGDLKSISPEYLIGLKARRSINKKRFYGKDALDTINILLAPNYKETLKEINQDKLSKILRENVPSDYDQIEDYFNFIYSYKDKIKKEESSLLENSLNSLKKNTKKIYSFS